MTSYPSRESWSQPVTPRTFEHSQSRPSARHSRPGSQEHLSKKTFSPTCRKCEGGGPCVCLQEGLLKTSIAVYDNSNMEIDFTTVPKKRSSTAAGLRERPSNSSIQQNPQADSCGFCTDQENCICAMAERQESTAKYDGENLAYAPHTTDLRNSEHIPAVSQYSSPNAQQPGGCDRCVADPERARWCRMLAQEVPPATSSPLMTNTTSGPGATIPAPAKRLPSLRSQNLLSIDSRTSMTCDEAYDEFAKRPLADRQADGLRFVRQLKARPVAGVGPGESAVGATSSAFEVDMASVLSAMKGSGSGQGTGSRRTSRDEV